MPQPWQRDSELNHLHPVFFDKAKNLTRRLSEKSIPIGAAMIKQRWAKTGDAPILAAAAFNAGGLYNTNANPWHLRTTGDHLDRAARWCGDACAVLKEVGG